MDRSDSAIRQNDEAHVHKATTNLNVHKLKHIVDDKIQQCEVFPIRDDINMELLPLEICDTIIDNIKKEVEVSTGGIEIEFCNKSFCDHCHNVYQDYCTKCRMLVHILNKTETVEVVPNGILEIGESSGRVGIFALKVIPEGVKFGPFTGLSASEGCWKLKAAEFLIAREDSTNYFNWMQHIKIAKNTYEQNLLPFQYDYNLYYNSSKKIQEGEELLVYFGNEYEDNLSNGIDMDFIPPAEDDLKDVFACTFCCLGFSSRKYLVQHKTVCPHETIEKFLIEELTQCSTCKIYLDMKEYFEYHRAYCIEKNERNYVPPKLDSQAVEIQKCRKQRSQLYKCKQCNYKTSYNSELKNHLNQHYEVKTYKCRICCRYFNTEGSLKCHMENQHINIKGIDYKKCDTSDYVTISKAKVSKEGSQFKRAQHNFQTQCESHLFECVKIEPLEECDNYKYEASKFERNESTIKEYNYRCVKSHFKTKQKASLRKCKKVKHLKTFDYQCVLCEFKTSLKRSLEIHTKTKHLKEFTYKCVKCNFRTNFKTSLRNHIKTKHLKQFSYKCASCSYEINHKTDLERHIKTKHLKEFDHKCRSCDYQTSRKEYLENHIKSKHLKEYKHKCKLCQFETNHKQALEIHMKTKHLKQFDYRCEICKYKTNHKTNFDIHIKSRHLKEFTYKCDSCEYRTNNKSHLEKHIDTKHLKKFNYKCDSCEYTTNRKEHLETHVGTKHLKDFSHKCTLCHFQTNYDSHLEIHIKTKHLKEFDFKCASCEFRTNYKSHLEKHIKTKHLGQFDYTCNECDYSTNRKLDLQRHIKGKHHK